MGLDLQLWLIVAEILLNRVMGQFLPSLATIMSWIRLRCSFEISLGLPPFFYFFSIHSCTVNFSFVSFSWSSILLIYVSIVERCGVMIMFEPNTTSCIFLLTSIYTCSTSGYSSQFVYGLPFFLDGVIPVGPGGSFHIFMLIICFLFQM